MAKTIKATKSIPKENCCGKQVKKAGRKKIIYKKTIKKRR